LVKLYSCTKVRSKDCQVDIFIFVTNKVGSTDKDPIKVSSRGNALKNYKLVETGTDTGIFTGEVILTGFTPHDADGDGDTTDASGLISADGGGPTDGLFPTDDDDGLTVSYKEIFSK
jgi:hypothetical protein